MNDLTTLTESVIRITATDCFAAIPSTDSEDSREKDADETHLTVFANKVHARIDEPVEHISDGLRMVFVERSGE